MRYKNNIFQAKDFNFIEKYINKADEQTLVIFDIDDVLITSRDEILKPYNNEFAERLEQNLESRFSEEDCLRLWSTIWLQRRNDLVEPQIIPLINKLILRKIKILSLTNSWTGSFGDIKSIEDWRIEELSRFGYNFGVCWEEQKIDIELKPKYPNRFPLFKQGILFTCGISKGQTLKYFMKKISWIPKKIIFIDDILENIYSVENYATEIGIDFLGFQYTSVKDQQIWPLNRIRAQIQFKTLENEKIWLSDAEVDKRYTT
ncbi:MAG: DUF2608 domain-containing protein [Parachlamydiaceae bacterium]|nr:DUF2608 domain-containing protein [Parachlamydiaceae bacterium]